VGEEFKIKILRLEEGYDPDLFIRKRGAEAYAKALSKSPNYFDYLVDHALRSFPVKTPEGKKNAVNYLLPHIQRLPNRIERDSLANDIAQKLGIDSAVLRMEFRAAAVRRANSPFPGGHSASDAQITPAEKILVRAVSTPARENAGLRRRAIDVLAAERLHMGLGVESLLESLLAGAEEGEGQAADPMSLALNEGDRELLTRIIMRENELLTAELLEGALEALRHRAQLAQRENEIKRGIVEAERANDVAALLRLKQEKLELDRKLAGE